ncbi:cysteine desulfurase [Patescibacteria group bacterium]|nr:cysteine desulfurase [Patescibacteria group bacterium]MBU1728157.1 cysteine desulfurase [Patescibacteria group bacterium]
MEKSKKIYLDFASTTPVDPRVSFWMQKILKNNFANASAIHNLGVETKKILEKSRMNVAKIIEAHGDEIIFTSGATESNNLAIFGTLENVKSIYPHIVTTNIEHPSVLEVCKHLEKNKKAEVTYVPVEESGIIDPKKIRKALKPNTVLVSVMYANNEIGTIQPIQEVAKEIRYFNKVNSKKIIFHSDTTQGINYLPIRVERLGVDLMSFNGGKIYGPKGVGILFKKRKVELTPTIFGGNQEFGLRSGTENIVGIAGLSLALEITEKMKEKENRRLTNLRDYFIQKLLKLSSEIKLNGDLYKRLPNNINITIPRLPSDLLVLELSARGIFVSEKSACKAGEAGNSYVVEALSRNKSNSGKICKKNDKKIGSLRFSMGRQTTKLDIDYTIKSLAEILKKLKRWYN